ncbi:efflux RND transporter periplasmic adaptor subunit [Aliifodinibius sp. S!AR15-10]|uniref:efflux RND transporter periplasmic adaptor subunit n=1 Tax=Aliifodinibius sp. S!AR15-10 TaxID=2950437 RepID=UPI00285C5933|nr:efflux RND transporter periplasmic adaptor subunit [Aliifodinibius sp. S!AR15-10]MDR8391274.1 efflux RND transporter periplasmic adaptor subunit [Aliifodinibius sp. S!AR15-10]
MIKSKVMGITRTKIIFYLYLSVAVLWSCSNNSSEDQNPLSEEEQESVEVRPEVVFAVADDQPIYQYIESQGVVEANKSANLKPRISGYVETSHITEGKQVRKGDTLLTFVDDEWEYALKEARNSYKQALSEYKIENRSQNVIESLDSGERIIARDDSLVRIYSGLANAKLNVERAQLDLSYAVMTAPFSGKLYTEERIASGSYLGAGTEVGRLVDSRTVRIRFDVLESELSKIEPGMTVALTAPGGEELQGMVEAVAPVVNTETKTGTIIVEADNADGLLTPGMTVEGRIQVLKQEGKTRVPRSAILSRDGGRTLLFKLQPSNNEVQWVYVEPVAQNGEWAIVNHEEVAPGDTIAVDRHFALSHLQIVEPRMELTEGSSLSGR